MSITHKFHSTKAEQSDSTLVGPNEWNATHQDSNSVISYGATGNGTTDDSASIRTAIAAVSAAGGGTVFFPNGTYKISENGTSTFYCLDIPANITLLGQSKEGTILKMAAAQENFTRPILIQTADVRIANMTIDGNKSGQLSDDEHRAGIFLFNATNTVIEDCILQNHTGDGIDLSVATLTFIARCNIENNDRCGIVWNTTTLYTSVRDCYLLNNTSGQLHVEADSVTVCTGIWVESCYCGPLTGTQPISWGTISTDVTMRDCIVDGGVNIVQATRVLIEGCLIQQTDPAGNGVVQIGVECQDITFRSCTIAQLSPTASGGQALFCIAVGGQSTFTKRTQHILFDDCHIIQNGTASNMSAVDIRDCRDVTFRACRLECAAANTNHGIQIFATDTGYANPQTSNIKIERCYFYNFNLAIWAAIAFSGGAIEGLEVLHNLIEGASGASTAEAYLMTGANGGPSLVTMMGNRTKNLTTVWDGGNTFPPGPILIGGNWGQGGIYSCGGSPNGVISEIIGAMALRRDGAATTTLYLNTGGGTTWTVVAST